MAYMHTRLSPQQADALRRELAAQQLDGFNPLKAIGRALGSTGRALVSAIPVVGPAASTVLTTAAKLPAKPTASGTPTTAPTSTDLVQSSPSSAASPQQQASEALLKEVRDMMAAQRANQPNAQSSPAPQIIYAPPAPAPAAASAAMPPWIIPAAIGGAGLMLALALGRR